MITVLGATGNTGRRTAEGLLAAGERVRAVGRDAGRLARAVPDAEPWVGDAGDREFLTRAFTGADAAYVLVPFDPFVPGYVEQQAAVGGAIADALVAADVPYVVALSSLGAEVDADTGFLRSLHDQERRLRDRPGVLFLRPGLFFESFAAVLDVVREQGVHADTIDPAVALPMVATADVADVAVRALLTRERTGVQEVLGPRDRTVPDVVAALGARLGLPDLRYVRVPDDQARGALVEAGLPADVADLQVRMNAAFNAGTVRSAGRTVQAWTPTEFEEWADALVAPIG
jgi:uncharacterized protein YbjT (DUF2867 family)